MVLAHFANIILNFLKPTFTPGEKQLEVHMSKSSGDSVVNVFFSVLTSGMGSVRVTCGFVGREYGNLGNHERNFQSLFFVFVVLNLSESEPESKIARWVSIDRRKTWSDQGLGVVPVMMLVPETLMTQQDDGFELVCTVQMLAEVKCGFQSALTSNLQNCVYISKFDHCSVPFQTIFQFHSK